MLLVLPFIVHSICFSKNLIYTILYLLVLVLSNLAIFPPFAKIKSTIFIHYAHAQ